MNEVHSISELPNSPAVYALYGGRGKRSYVAYVGIADSLKRRIMQHLVTRDGSVATGTTATGINPDYVTQVTWWEHPQFKDRAILRVAEMVASDQLEPALRSRGSRPANADSLLKDKRYHQEMASLFTKQPNGRFIVPSLQELADKVAHLQKRVKNLEATVARK
jgi:hypothetical protein